MERVTTKRGESCVTRDYVNFLSQSEEMIKGAWEVRRRENFPQFLAQDLARGSRSARAVRITFPP